MEDLSEVRALIERQEFVKAHSIILEKLLTLYDDDGPITELLRLQEKCESIDDGKYAIYNKEKVEALTAAIEKAKLSPPKPRSVTVTMTACKRPDLFFPTVDSLINCCTDLIEYIHDWIVVDDNSDEKDREEMRRKYPFINFVMKTPEEKGHARSMNMLIPRIKTPYFFHLEDDWRFFIPGRFITRCLDVLEENPKFGQCLLNKSYGEDLFYCGKIGGGYRRYTKNFQRYYIHEYLAGDALQVVHDRLQSLGLSHSCYWPHYSLRVGLTRTRVLATVGQFNETAQHFEREYAYRYIQCKFLTTYLDNVYCTHTGRKTYERSTTKLNAYDLNKERQFGEDPKLLEDAEIKLDSVSSSVKKNATQNDQPPDKPQNSKNIIIKTFIINLKRRDDRLKDFHKNNWKELCNYHVFDAIDGMKLKPNHTLQRLFQHNNYNYRRGIVGCALSHIAIWNELITNNMDGLIIEDDAVLTKDFMCKFMIALSSSPEADIIFLGHHPYPEYLNPKDFRMDLDPTTERWSRARCQRESMGGTTAYYITKKGAASMLNYINQNSVTNGIDWVMFKTADINKIYYCSPFLAFADCVDYKPYADTDIQNVFDGTGYESLEVWLKEEVKYWMKELNETSICGKLLDFSENKNSKIKFLDISSFKEGDEKRVIDKKTLLSSVNIIKCSKLPEELNLYPISFYIVGREHIITVPDNMITDSHRRSRTFDGYLNRYSPLGNMNDCR